MVLIAFSLQDQVEKYGAYIGIAAFFGLAILSLLYFAQAREVKRLREWAGRAPERAAELELAVAEHAQEVRRAPVTPVPAPQPVVAQPLSPSVAATNGVVKLKPEEVAALAFARAAGVHEPHEPKAHPEPVAAAVAEPETQVAQPAQALNGGNGHTRAVPAPVTPAARRADVPPPPPLPPRRASAARRPVAPPPEREGSGMLAVILTAIVGVIAIGAVLFFFVLRGGDEPKTAANNTPKVETTSTPAPDATEAPAKQTPAPTKDTALIAVYNGTGIEGLAKQQTELLRQEGYPQDNLAADNAPPDQPRQSSVVMYRRGSKTVAAQVADTLGISAVQQLDDATQQLIANSPKKWNVVVIVGNDKTN
ncbi:LytR C-terminal domain-containing protein [Solirubrobacter soli]|uniref:LytR C-terminal domain-containing protein n=1 Tax=Solirubrobacter soli TaxID=363832 RepID=UPI0004193A12|nr:LytR C-terminal domain-containing protein [Solirubrobacter soli]